jgi:hypothetical protein
MQAMHEIRHSEAGIQVVDCQPGDAHSRQYRLSPETGIVAVNDLQVHLYVPKLQVLVL